MVLYCRFECDSNLGLVSCMKLNMIKPIDTISDRPKSLNELDTENVQSNSKLQLLKGCEDLFDGIVGYKVCTI